MALISTTNGPDKDIRVLDGVHRSVDGHLSGDSPMRMSTEELHDVLNANFESGLLYWKPRAREKFKSDRAWNAWNAKFANKQALTCKNNTGYFSGAVNKHPLLAHRVLFAMKHGYWPEFIDHINGIRTDNRIENLRAATRQINGKNVRRPIHNTSGVIGVSWNNRDKRWAAYITIQRKRKSLGNFINKEDAIACRKANEKLFGFHENHGRA